MYMTARLDCKNSDQYIKHRFDKKIEINSIQ